MVLRVFNRVVVFNIVVSSVCHVVEFDNMINLKDSRCKLNVHTDVHLLNILCTFNLSPVSKGLAWQVFDCPSRY